MKSVQKRKFRVYSIISPVDHMTATPIYWIILWPEVIAILTQHTFVCHMTFLSCIVSMPFAYPELGKILI